MRDFVNHGPPKVIRAVKQRSLRWAEHAVRNYQIQMRTLMIHILINLSFD
jgi:hypothetical protein